MDKMDSVPQLNVSEKIWIKVKNNKCHLLQKLDLRAELKKKTIIIKDEKNYNFLDFKFIDLVIESDWKRKSKRIRSDETGMKSCPQLTSIGKRQASERREQEDEDKQIEIKPRP